MSASVKSESVRVGAMPIFACPSVKRIMDLFDSVLPDKRDVPRSSASQIAVHESPGRFCLMVYGLRLVIRLSMPLISVVKLDPTNAFPAKNINAN